MRKYIKQNPRLNHRSIAPLELPTEDVPRSAVHHHTLRKAKVLDGCTSSTGLWDSEPGQVPEVFDIKTHKLDLANSLIQRGESLKTASKVAENGSNVEASSSSTE